MSDQAKPTAKMLSGLPVYIGQDGTMFIELPEEIDAPDSGCCCEDCKVARENGEAPRGFNTLAVHKKSSHTWLVHTTPKSLSYALKNGWKLAGKCY